MNYKKIYNILLERELVDDRKLFCHSNASVSFSTNYIVVTKFTTNSQPYLPRFMVLSICKDQLHICKAGNMTGKPKDFFATIDIDKLKYIGFKTNDFTDIYEFTIDYGDGKEGPFFIQGVAKKSKMKELVRAISKGKQ